MSPATTKPRSSQRAIDAAMKLNRIAQGRLGEPLAEVTVGNEVVDVRAFERRPRQRRAGR